MTPALERLYDDPLDAAVWAVFADELQAAGDPRGELIALATAGKHHRLGLRLKKYLAQTLDPQTVAALPRVDVSFDHGLWSGLTARDAASEPDTDTCELVATLLANPLSALLRSLEAQLRDPRGPYRIIIALEQGAPALRHLHVAASRQWNASGIFTPPRLEAVSLSNVTTVGAVRHARLQNLSLTFAPEATPGSLRCPALRTLEFLSRGDVPLEDLALELPGLRRLTLQAFPGVIVRLALLPIAAQLERLTILSVSPQFDARVAGSLLARLGDFTALRKFEWRGGPLAANQQVQAALSARRGTRASGTTKPE